MDFGHFLLKIVKHDKKIVKMTLKMLKIRIVQKAQKGDFAHFDAFFIHLRR